MQWIPGRRAHVVVIHQYFIVFFPIQLKKLSIALENVLFQYRNSSLNVALLVTLASKCITVKEKDKYIKKKYHRIQYLIYKFLFLLRWLCC